MSDLVLPQPYSKWIFSVSFLSVGTTFFAVSKNAFCVAWMPFIVSLTSLNYWRFPLKGWRRNTDMTAVGSSILYKFYLIPKNPYGSYVLLSMMMGGLCYRVARLSDCHRTSAMFHCSVHFFGNIALWLLILGLENEGILT